MSEKEKKEKNAITDNNDDVVLIIKIFGAMILIAAFTLVVSCVIEKTMHGHISWSGSDNYETQATVEPQEQDAGKDNHLRYFDEDDVRAEEREKTYVKIIGTIRVVLTMIGTLMFLAFLAGLIFPDKAPGRNKRTDAVMLGVAAANLLTATFIDRFAPLVTLLVLPVLGFISLRVSLVAMNRERDPSKEAAD